MKHTTHEFRTIIARQYLDLTKDFFELTPAAESKLSELYSAFGFNGANNLGRSKLRQFYYYLQNGNRKLPF